MAWLAGLRGTDRKVVVEAFKDALAKLPADLTPEAVTTYHSVRLDVERIIAGTDPRGGRFIDQARLVAGRVHDAAVRASLFADPPLLEYAIRRKDTGSIFNEWTGATQEVIEYEIAHSSDPALYEPVQRTKAGDWLSLPDH